MNWTRLLTLLLITTLAGFLPKVVGAQESALALPDLGGVETPGEVDAIAFRVSGQVTSPDGHPVVGATIREKGTTNGTLSDENGKYSFEVKDGGAVLVVTYYGLKTQEIDVASRASINIKMEEDITSLDEVVVVGYGTQVKRDITGNISSVKGEDLVKVPSISVDQGLQGMAAGVQVASASGIAGAPVRVMVRGTNSISASTEPLWVIDGMIVGSGLSTGIRSSGGTEQNPLANINPNDIESIEILKDAAATAIYGSRGSNGVIIVTTKTGNRAGGDGSLSINYQYGVTTLTNHPRNFMMTNGDDWLNLVNEARTNSNLDPLNPSTLVRQDLYNENEVISELTEAQIRGSVANWDNIINNGNFHDINLTTSKAFNGGSYYISANYRDEQGVLSNPTLNSGNRFQRFATRINADIKPFPSLTIGTRTTLSYTNNRRVSPGGGGGPGGNENLARPGFGIAVTHRPVFPNEAGFDTRSGNNFLATLNNENLRDQSYSYRALSGVFAQWDLPWVPGLAIRTEASADIQLLHSILWGNTVVREESPYAFDAQLTNTNLLYNAYATYNREFGQHNISVSAGTERQQRGTRGSNIEGDNLFGTAQEVGGPGNILRIGGFGNTGPNIISFFSRANYSFDGKYLLGVSFRRDASTAFLRNIPAERRSEIIPETWSNFPGVSAGWVISEEDFMDGVPVINFLKLRASYGVTGNNGIPANLDALQFADWGRYGSRDNNVNGGSLLSNIPAEGITWETTETFDVGVDFELFDSRVSGSVAYFNQAVSDLILQVPIPPSSGLFSGSAIWANIGDMVNRGWEFSFTSYNVNTKDFRWTTNFNITFNSNEVTRLSPVLDENQSGINEGITTTYAGGMLGEFFLAPYAGLNEFGGYPEIYYVDMSPEIDDGNGNMIPNPDFNVVSDSILPADRNTVRNNKVRTGKSGLPTYFGGITNTLSYKGIEFSFQFVFQGGNWIFDNNERNRSRIGGAGSNYLQSLADDHWSPENLDARHPLPTWNNRYDTYTAEGEINRTNQRFDYRGNQYHDQYLQRGDFLRLRNLQVAYTLPQAVTEKMNLSNVRFFATGTNLLTFTGFEGIDPEQAVIGGGSRSRNLAQGVFNTQLPPLRMFSGGLSVNF